MVNCREVELHEGAVLGERVVEEEIEIEGLDRWAASELLMRQSVTGETGTILGSMNEGRPATGTLRRVIATNVFAAAVVTGSP